MIRILLVEDMCLLRVALAVTLSQEDDLEVAAELGGGEDIRAVARAVRPNVMLIDIDLTRIDAVTIASELSGELPDCRIMLLAGSSAPALLRRALDTKVRGFVGKELPPCQLAQSIRRVASGERVIDPAFAVSALSVPPNPLTPRERDVLRVAQEGAPSAEIASRLYLSQGTVRNYLSAILRKTAARNRLEAVRIARDCGWL